MTFLAFHPHHMVLGCASNDGASRPGSTDQAGHVNLFQMSGRRDLLDSFSSAMSFAPFI